MNSAPTVDAGSDVTVSLSTTANLNGTVTDDGWPTSSVTTTWTKVKGPGTVTFGNSTHVDTTARFSASGTYVLRLTASDNNLTASDDTTITVVSTAPALAVVSFTLINAEANQPLAGYGPLPNGTTLDLSALPTRQLNIRADTSPATVGSVRFALDGSANFRTESSAPYALAGDTGGDYASWTPTLGPHTLKATPYSGGGATGTAGTALTITFEVTD
jgi:hypothetical protein